MSTYGEIYLMIDGNCKKKNEHIYIIGKSQPEQGVYDVLNYYSKDSKILYHQYTNDTINTMKKIKLCFDKKFIKKQEYGDNWYQGDLIEILLEKIRKIKKEKKLKLANYVYEFIDNINIELKKDVTNKQYYKDLFKNEHVFNENINIYIDKFVDNIINVNNYGDFDF